MIYKSSFSGSSTIKHKNSESIAALRFYMVFTFTFRRSFGELPPLKGEGDRLAVEGFSELLNVNTTDGRG